MTLPISHPVSPRLPSFPEGRSTHDADDIIYDDCGIDWAVIADESERDLQAGLAIPMEEAVIMDLAALDEIMRMTPEELDAAIAADRES